MTMQSTAQIRYPQAKRKPATSDADKAQGPWLKLIENNGHLVGLPHARTGWREALIHRQRCVSS